MNWTKLGKENGRFLYWPIKFTRDITGMTKKNSLSKQKTIPTKKHDRNQRGKVDGTVMFPTAPPKAELPESYTSWLAELKSNIANT